VPFFSVVIAALNASPTLPSTIASLAQTFPDWEAIVVDDGSTDDTVSIVQRHAERDARIRLVRATSHGVSAARNQGLAAASGPWLLFLDADDTLFPGALAAWHAGIEADPAVDVLCGGWVRVAPDGRVVTREHWPITRDMFPVFARLSAYAIHSCVTRRSAVVAAGGFDTTLVTCEDWDLWQRMARAGAQFGRIPEDVARYHMRPRSASLAARQMMADGFRVITTGHGPDSRVRSPLPQYAAGMPKGDAAAIRVGYACWPAGLVLGSGDDAVSLLEGMVDDRAADLDPSIAADALFRSAMLPRCAGPEQWAIVWPEIRTAVNRFLEALEHRTGARLLARRVRTALARLILENVQAATLTRVGATILHVVDITKPVDALRVPSDVERVVIRIQAGDAVIGSVELPICDGCLDPAVIRDAIARDYGWSILGRFFEPTVYEEVVRRNTRGGAKAVRRNVVLAPAPRTDAEWNAQRHETVGWTVFLQELWGHPDWPVAAFYDADCRDTESTQRPVQQGWLTLDVLDAPTDWTTDSTDGVNVELTIADAPVCCITVSANGGLIRGSRLRALLTRTAGLELLNVAVREGLIGRAWYRGSLRQHLSQRRSTTHSGTPSSPPALDRGAPSAARHVSSMLRADPARALIGARRYGWPGSAASRRAALPSAARRDLFESARLAGEPLVRVAAWRRTKRIAYVPDALWAGAQQPLQVPGPGSGRTTSTFGRHHFESLFAGAADPWRYTSPYEARKYEQTLSLLPPEPVRRALEIGCAEGHFTDALAPHVDMLVVADISSIALERAAERCAARQNVSFVRLDVSRDALPGDNDVIVCSELLYYVGSIDELERVGRALRDALHEGGRLLTAHARVASDEPNAAGFVWDVPFGARTIRDTLRQIPGLQLARELRTALYSVMEFERTDQPRTPHLVPAEFVMPEPHVAERIRWSGGESPAPAPRPGARLPILMYHRVSDPAGREASRYTVSADQLRSHLEYLRDAGFHSVSLAEWSAAVHKREPLPGRPVALTFDDAYVDFMDRSLPLLQQYGFSATLFVVSRRVGAWNTWDAGHGERARLMDWAAVERAATSGVEIGAHSATHAPLTGLTPAEIVREASRARADIQRRIKQPIHALAYPYGDSDAVVQHLIAATGFLTGVTCRFGLSGLDDRPLRLPRIEVAGTDSQLDFIRKLGAP
jgi:peptidoglycan/xylan/chitin deacetylase (PgdA/CDA1 family)/protein-L-isoaspartate O-methyltransferase